MAGRRVDILVPVPVPAAAGSTAGVAADDARAGATTMLEFRAALTDRSAGGAQGVDPAIAPLAEVGLARAGRRALDCLRRLPPDAGGRGAARPAEVGLPPGSGGAGPAIADDGDSDGDSDGPPAPGPGGPDVPPSPDAALAELARRGLVADRPPPDVPPPRRPRVRLTRPAPARSQVTLLNGPDDPGDMPGAALRGTELGLALGLCALERGQGRHLFFAIGSLVPGLADPDTLDAGPVGPVEGMAAQCAAVASWIERHPAALPAGGATFYLPDRAPDGRHAVTAFAPEILEMCRRAEAAGCVLRVRPVASLAQAAADLGAATPALGPREVLARTALVLVLGLAILSGWAVRPLGIERRPVTYMGDFRVETPHVQAELSRSGPGDPRFGPISPCLGDDGVLQVRAGDRVAVNFATEPTAWPRLAYDVVFAAIGQTAAPRVFTMTQYSDDDAPGTGTTTGTTTGTAGRALRRDGGRLVFGAVFRTRLPAEEMKIVALGRKGWPFSADKLLQGLAALDRGPGGADRLNAQAGWLESRRGSYREASFRVITQKEWEESPCYFPD